MTRVGPADDTKFKSYNAWCFNDVLIVKKMGVEERERK